MSRTDSGSAGGTGLFTLLSVAFIVMKLCGVINWSWVWVLSPIWIPLIIGLAIYFIAWFINR